MGTPRRQQPVTRMPLAPMLIAASVIACLSAHAEQDRPLIDAGAPFGELPLVDEIECGNPDDRHEFKQDPAGTTRIETILGQKCRVLPTAGAAKYFAYVIGRGKGLEPGKAYVLSVEYPQDTSRSMFIGNRGAEVKLGFSTGRALGDVFKGRYVHHRPESLDIPLSGKYETWKTMPKSDTSLKLFSYPMTLMNVAPGRI